jgi:BirA family biotin operon repressor/biotin-[acetyl-CoA-carboxylase] ligase
MLKEYSIMAKIKWPNDIYVHNKKIAGILIENSLQGPTIVSSIIGIGMNINQIEFPDVLPDAISLRQAMGKSFDLKALLDALLRDLGVYYSSLKNKDFESIHQESTTICSEKMK